MFLGTYRHSIDDKGRLFLPAKLREGIGNAFIVTQGLEACLYLFDKKTFQSVIEKLSALPVKNQQDGRAFKRLMLAGAQDVELDDLGRVLVPKPLSLYAGLKKDISILGVGERIELWDEKTWNTYSKRAQPTFQKLGKHLEI